MYFGLRPVAVKAGSNLNIVHSDYLGTPRVVTSGTNGGSIVWQWKNDNPYGNNQAQGTLEFNLRFAGQYYDYESGLHYNIHRTYNPEVGRYMQSDPIGLAGGNNTYNYIGRNPLNGVDPLGLFGISGTNDKNLSGAIRNPLSVPAGSLGVTMHSKTGWFGTDIQAIVEAGSELYQLAKVRNPDMKALQNNEDLELSAEGLADLLSKTFDLAKYNDIYLLSCNLGSGSNTDEYYKQRYAQVFADAVQKRTFAYSAYIVGEKKDGEYYFSGYYTNALKYRKRNLGIGFVDWDTSFVESRDAVDVRSEFNPGKQP